MFTIKECPNCKTLSLPANNTCLNCWTRFVYVTPRSNLMLGIVLFYVWLSLTVILVQVWEYLYTS